MEVCSLQVWLHRRQPLLSFKSLSCQFLFVVSSWVYLSFFSTFFFYSYYSSFVSSFFFPLVTLGNNIEIYPDSSLEEYRHLAQDKISWQREKTVLPFSRLAHWNCCWSKVKRTPVSVEHFPLGSTRVLLSNKLPSGTGREQKQPSPHAK